MTDDRLSGLCMLSKDRDRVKENKDAKDNVINRFGKHLGDYNFYSNRSLVVFTLRPTTNLQVSVKKDCSR